MKFSRELHLMCSIVCILAICSSCGQASQVASESNEGTMSVVDNNAGLVNTADSRWTTRTRQVPFSGPVTAVYFQNASQGWIAQNDRLARTDDGGETWITKDIASPGSESISQIFFFDSLNGLVVSESDLQYPDSKYRIFITRDSGKTWKGTFDQPGYVAEVAYSFDRVFIVGSEHPERYRQRPLMIVSVDKGETWSRDDFTRGQETGLETRSNDAAMGIAFTSRGIVKVATGSGYVYSREIGEVEWQPRVKFGGDDFPNISTIVAFGITSGEKIWSLESGGPTEEGIQTRLYVEGAASQGKYIPAKESWTFSDGVHLGGESFLICGSEYKEHTDRKTKMISNTQAAVILQTKDAGVTLSEIFRDSKQEEFTAIYRLASDRFWAVGKNQGILELRRE